jgi:hypothetical protein
MNTQLFDELIDSIKEAGQIHREEIRASREFVVNADDLPAVVEETRKIREVAPKLNRGGRRRVSGFRR